MCSASPPGGVHAVDAAGQFDVLADGEEGEESSGLEDVADLAPADGGEEAVRGGGVDGDRSALGGMEDEFAVGVRMEDEAEDVEEGAFSAAALAVDDDELALPDIEAGHLEGEGLVAGAALLLEVGDLVDGGQRLEG